MKPVKSERYFILWGEKNSLSKKITKGNSINSNSDYTRRSFLEKISSIMVLSTGLFNVKSKYKYKYKKTIEEDIAKIDVSGIVDIHVHGNTRRKNYGKDITAYETARAMAKHGIKAWVDKEKRGYTWSTAEIVRRTVPGTLTFGSLVLDKTVGGINPSAVIAALSGDKRYAAGDSRVIWMPSSTNQIDRDVFITDSDGNTSSETKKVLKLIAENNVVLATGHLPYKHVIKLLPEAKKLGVKKIMITHPDWFDIEDQKEFGKFGVYFNRCIGTWSWWKENDFVRLKNEPSYFSALVKPSIENMKAVGIERNLISTDWGPHTFWDSPPLAMKPYIWALLENGITENEIDILARKNPAYLINV